MSIKRNELMQYLNMLLQPAKYKDYCPNGLQVEGSESIQKIVTGVTASQALIDIAIAEKADAIFVHHGYFWRGENPVLSGMKKRRIKALLENDISLLGYHLPLDAHPELGNNAQLAKRLGFIRDGAMNAEGVGDYGHLEQALSVNELAERMQQQLQRTPTVVSGGDHSIKTIAWCTGGAQSYIQQAIALGVDAFVSGEISEPTVHIANETGVNYFSAGHHATERGGVIALGNHLSEEFDVEFEFIDLFHSV